MSVNPLERGTSGEPLPVPYSIGYSALLLVNSFRFAQGDSMRQPTVLMYLALNFRSQFNPDIIKASVDPALQAAASVLSNRMQHREVYSPADTKMHTPDAMKAHVIKDQRTTMQGYADDLIGFVERDPEMLREKFRMEDLVRLVIENDALFLGLSEDSRHDSRSRKPGGPQNTFTDPYFSFWTYYGLQGNRGEEILPEYGKMFTDMVADFRANDGYADDLRELSAAIEDTYNQRHS